MLRCARDRRLGTLVGAIIVFPKIIGVDAYSAFAGVGLCDYRLLLARVVVLLLFFLDDVQLVLRVGKAG